MSDTRQLLKNIRDAIVEVESDLLHPSCQALRVYAYAQTIDTHLSDLNFVTEQEIMENIKSILDGLGKDAVRICEGGGPENLLMSLAVTVSRMQIKLEELRTEIDWKSA